MLCLHNSVLNSMHLTVINFMLNVIVLYKTNLNTYKIRIFYMFYKNIEKQTMFIIFDPLLYYMLGADLGLLLYGDVSVMYFHAYYPRFSRNIRPV